MDKHKEETGFALLMTIIVVGAVLSIGLSVLDLTLKQVRLSTNAKESEIAFHAANAGLECAQYWRRISSVAMESGLTISPVCFSGKSAENKTISTIISDVTNGYAYIYDYHLDWGFACTKVKTMVINTLVTGSGITVVDIDDTYFPAYPDSSKSCPPGAICTIISVQGYNKSCGTDMEIVNTSYGVVQREVLLEL